jgi:hypothetical protein
MKINGFVLRSDDQTRRVEIAGPDDVREWVGVPPLRFPLQGFDAFINEKAGPDLPVNDLATLILQALGVIVDDNVRGNILFLGPPDAAGDATDVPPSVMDFLEDPITIRRIRHNIDWRRI